MLLKRFLAATAMILLLITAMWFDFSYLEGSWLLHAFYLVAAFLAFREFWPMCRAAGHQTFSNWGTLAGCALVAAHCWTMHNAGLNRFTASQNMTEAFKLSQDANNLLNFAMAAAVLGAFLLTAHRRKYPASLGGLGVTCLGLIYLWFLPSFVLKLRHMGTDSYIGGNDWNTFGTKMVIATIVVSKGCDVAAFLVGRKVGKHKAFPMLSPGKTIEGVLAGLLGSMVLALILRMDWLSVFPAEYFNIWETLIFGLLVGFSGMMGDLAESVLKRSAGVKDAGQVIPGFGGMMDVIDSLVVAGPVAYFLVPLLLKWGPRLAPGGP